MRMFDVSIIVIFKGDYFSVRLCAFYSAKLYTCQCIFQNITKFDNNFTLNFIFFCSAFIKLQKKTYENQPADFDQPADDGQPADFGEPADFGQPADSASRLSWLTAG